jgi:hypothetical protein
MNNIHTIGDSHSKFGWDGISIVHHLGPILAYSFGKNPCRLDIKSLRIRDGDTIIFCFGEIDCRCHVNKFITDKKSFEMIIDNIVENYVDAIITCTRDLMNCKICVYNIVPPVKKTETKENPLYPFIGSDAERKTYVEYFNMRLREVCRCKNIYFIDVYEKYCDDDGFLNKCYSDGHVHIKDGNFIREAIRYILNSKHEQ